MKKMTNSIDKIQKNLHADDKKIHFIGYAIIVFTLLFFGLWSFFAPLDSSVIAQGTIVVKSHSKTIQHLEGGVVNNILIKDGDLVETNQPLIILNNTDIKAQLEIARMQNIALSAQTARLTSERDNLKKINFSDSLLNSSDLKTLEIIETENNTFHTRKNALEGETSILRLRVDQTSSKIRELENQIYSKKKLLDSYTEEIKELKELLSEGFTDKIHLRDVERNHSILLAEISQLYSDVSTNKLLINETKLQITQIEKKFKEEVNTALGEINVKLSDSTERLLAIQDKLDRSVIRAPSNGMVFGLSVHNSNNVISAGEPILYIVPQNSELIIEAQILPSDIERVSKGLQTEVRFTSFNQSEMPELNGKVIELSADLLSDQKTGISYYQVKIDLTQESIR
ncbi:MAG: HlyD family type I secretion periplasmic adaptor subunit, partial [Oscillospiraceae bacterium]